MKAKKKTKVNSPKKGDKKEMCLISPKVDEQLKKSWVSLVFLAVLFLVAFFIRLSLLKYYHAPLTGDAAIYGKIAWGIKNGHGLHWWSMVWSPFYPFMISLFSFVVGSLESAAFAVSVFLGSLVVVPFFFLARKMFDYRAAYLGSILVVFFPALIVTSVAPLSEATYTFFLLLTLLAGWLLISKRSYLCAFIFGILSGICYLTRPEFLVGFVFILLVFLALEMKKRARGKPPTLALLSVCLVGFWVLAFPYMKFLHTQSGHWMLSGKTAHNVLKQKAYSRGTSLLEQRMAFAEALGGLTEDGEMRGKMLLGKQSIISFVASPGFFNFYIGNAWAGVKRTNLLFLPFLFLFLFYMFSQKVDKEGWQKRVFLLCAFSPILTMPIFLPPAGRLIEPYSPLLILLAVMGILNIRKSLAGLSAHKDKAWGFTPGSLAVILVIVLLSFFSVVKANKSAEDDQVKFKYVRLESEEYKKLGLWADRILPKGAAVLFLSGDSFSFYCNRVTARVPLAPFEKIVQFAQKNKAEFLVVSVGTEALWPDHLLFLLEPLDNPYATVADPRLRLIDVYRSESGFVALLYKLVS